MSIRLPVDVDAEVPRYRGSRRSFALTMRDGVRLAVDLWLPGVERPVPTALRSTRYWRSRTGTPVLDRLAELEGARWIRTGFALVLVDARGTGASTGTWLRPWDDDQREDLRQVVDWVVGQPWSDGTVGGFGTSYDGTTAHLLASLGHPAVRAVVPRFALYDAFAHISVPGGLPDDWFLESWAAGNWHLDGYPSRATCPPAAPLLGDVRRLDEDTDASLLATARAEHADNWDLWHTAAGAVCREEIVGADGVDLDDGTPFGRVEQLRTARVPMWVWTSWYDGAYAAAALAQLGDEQLDVRVTIGPWSHGAAFAPLGSPFAPAAVSDLPPAAQQEQIAAFLRARLTGSGDDPSPGRLRYYTVGEEAWHESDRWPPPGLQQQAWSLAADGLLGGDATGHRTYDVDFAASSGPTTRWHTLIGGGPVHYPDRAERDRRLLAWDSEPLPADLEVTGTAELHLDVVSTADDGAFLAYLEDVAPDGTVTYVTEGQLRALHRRLAPAPYAADGPWHSCRTVDTEPLVPGRATRLSLALWPVSARFRAGHRVRLALAGADDGLFRRVPASGPVTWRVASTSTLVLPQRERS